MENEADPRGDRLGQRAGRGGTEQAGHLGISAVSSTKSRTVQFFGQALGQALCAACPGRLWGSLELVCHGPVLEYPA
jgi:hypothetical protein